MRKLLILIALGFCATTALADDKLDLDQYAGKVVVIDFWASWCVPCRRSFPWLNQMHSRYEADGLVILGINVDRDANNAAVFLEKYPAMFPIIYDAEGELPRTYDIQVMPSSVIIGRDGNIVGQHSGFKVKRQLEYEETLRTALGIGE